jgi:hypothetical protein
MIGGIFEKNVWGIMKHTTPLCGENPLGGSCRGKNALPSGDTFARCAVTSYPLLAAHIAVIETIEGMTS